MNRDKKEITQTLAIYLPYNNIFIDHVCLDACSCFSSHDVLAPSHRHPYASHSGNLRVPVRLEPGSTPSQIRCKWRPMVEGVHDFPMYVSIGLFCHSHQAFSNERGCAANGVRGGIHGEDFHPCPILEAMSLVETECFETMP